MICHLDRLQNTIGIILIPRNHLDKLWFTFSEEVIIKGSLTLAMGKCLWFSVKIKVCQSSLSSP